VSGPSQALQLVLRIAAIEAAHAGSELLAKDHIMLGLLKIVDIDLDPSLIQCSEVEREATLREVAELREALGTIDVTTTRRSLRQRAMKVNKGGRTPPPHPLPSRQYNEAMAKLAAGPERWGCRGLLKILLKNPGAATAAELCQRGIDPESLGSGTTEKKPDATLPPVVKAMIELHRAWSDLPNPHAPELSDLWRRLGNDMILEFDGKGAISVLQSGGIFFNIPREMKGRRLEIFGNSLSDAIAIFEDESCVFPCKVPLVEF